MRIIKEIIIKLLRDYYDTDLIIRDIVVSRDKGKETINIFPNLAPAKWRLYVQGTIGSDGIGKPDIKGCEEILDGRRLDKAKQIYRMTKRILRDKGKKSDKPLEKDYDRDYGITPNIKEAHHSDLIDYSFGALLATDTIHVDDVVDFKTIVDEHGILIGQKKLPEEKYDEIGEE